MLSGQLWSIHVFCFNGAPPSNVNIFFTTTYFSIEDGFLEWTHGPIQP